MKLQINRRLNVHYNTLDLKKYPSLLLLNGLQREQDPRNFDSASKAEMAASHWLAPLTTSFKLSHADG